MKNSIKNSLKISLCVIGTLIGAGFASGQEILSFFIVYGEKSAWGIVIFALLLSVYILSVLGMSREENLGDYRGYLNLFLPPKISALVELCVTLFSFASYCIMLSGTGVTLNRLFGFHPCVGAMLMSGVCLLIFSKDAKGIVNASAILTPIIIVFITLMGISAVYADASAGAFSIRKITDNFIFSAFIYVSYNTLSLTPVLVELKNYTNSKKVIHLSAIFSSLFLGIMAAFIWYTLIKFQNTIVYDEIPMLSVATFFGGIYRFAYPVVMFAAMLTTAVSSGFGFVCNVQSKSSISRKKISTLMCILAVPMSLVGFSTLISRLYTFFGYIGIAVFVLGIFKYFLKK